MLQFEPAVSSLPYMRVRELGELRISHSSMQLFSSCARKFEFRKLLEAQGDGDQTLAAEFGSAIHAGFQKWLETDGDETAALWAFMLRYPWDMERTGYGRSRYIPETGFAVLQSMFSTVALSEYEIATVTLPDGTTRPAIEVPFELELENFSLAGDTNVKVIYTGFIDAILYNHLTRKYMVVDIKTTSRMMEDMGAMYQFSDQCIPYAIVLEKLLGVAAIEELEIRYIACYVDLEKPNTQMLPYDKTSEDISDWASGYMHKLHSMREFFERAWFPRNGDSCANYNRTCEYMPYCHDRDAVRLSQFFQETPRTRPQPEPWVRVKLALT
jgi:hypothetical protein